MNRATTVVASLAIVMTGAANAAPVSVSDYLSEVKKSNPAFRSANMGSEAGELKSKEADLIFLPQFVGQSYFHYDKQPSFGPFRYADAARQYYEFGLQHQTRIGLKHSLTYRQTVMQARGILGVPVPGGRIRLYEPSINYDFSISLFRNVAGREARAQYRAAHASALATGLGERFKGKAALVEAEGTYWRLALAREAVKVQTETLAYSKKMLDWTNRRVKMQLADSGDGYQVQAAYDLRRLQLQAAIDEERSARLAFNSLRGKDNDEVTEPLVEITPDLIADFKVPERVKMRDDVKAAELGQVAAIASAELGRERNLPTVELFFSGNLWAQEPFIDTAHEAMFDNPKPGMTVGLKFQAPLGVGKAIQARRGFALEREAASANFERKLIDQERDWDDLVKKISETRTKYALALKVEQLQGQKVAREREKLSLGRTVTAQVITFEQDLQSSQLSRLQLQAQILSLVAQMKLFWEKSE